MNQSPSQAFRDEDDIDILAIISSLYANKLLIISCVVLFFVMANIYVNGKKPVYEANALIHIEAKESDNLGLSNILGNEKSDVATEIEIIKSRFVLGQVVDDQLLQAYAEPKRLPLARYFPAINDYLIENAIDAKDPSQLDRFLKRFNTIDAEIKLGHINLSKIDAPQHFTLTLSESDTFTVSDKEGNHLHSWPIKATQDINAPTTIQFEKIKAHIGAEFNFLILRRINAIRQLRNQLNITEKGRKTGILAITLRSADRDKVGGILGQILATYASQNKERLSEKAERSIQFLHDQIPLIKASLKIAEDEVSAYRAKTSNADMQIETETVLNKIVAIESRLNELDLKENEISERYKKSHPIYITLTKQRKSLLGEKEKINSQIEKLPLKQQKLLDLMRNVEVTSAIYLQLRNKIEELKVVRAGTVGNVRILDQAEVLPMPVSPRKMFTVLLAAVFGGVVGVMLALLRVWLNTGLTSPKEVEEKLKLPNYGVIPLSKGQRRIDKQTPNTESQPGMLAVLDTEDIALESIRSIRTSLHFAMMEAKNNIVVLTSAGPNAGKSFICTNLAALIAQSGQKVLLIDIYLRRGRIHKAMGRERFPGLSNLLSEGAEPEQVIHSNIMPNMDFIGAGELPPNPSELLMSQAFSGFLDQMSKRYDIVIIDTPPVLAVTDAALIGRQAGANLLVIRHGRNSLNEIRQVQSELNNMGVSLKGYIYNFHENKLSNRYAYGYNYRYDYRKNPKEGKLKWKTKK